MQRLTLCFHCDILIHRTPWDLLCWGKRPLNFIQCRPVLHTRFSLYIITVITAQNLVERTDTWIAAEHVTDTGLEGLSQRLPWNLHHFSCLSAFGIGWQYTSLGSLVFPNLENYILLLRVTMWEKVCLAFIVQLGNLQLARCGGVHL